MKHNKANYSQETESNFKAAEHDLQRATGHGEDRLEMTEIHQEHNEPLGHKDIQKRKHKQYESKDTSNGRKCLKVLPRPIIGRLHVGSSTLFGALRNKMKAKEHIENLQKSNTSTQQNWYNTPVDLLQELRIISEEMRCQEEDENAGMESHEPTQKPTLLAMPMPDGDQELTTDQNLAENAQKVEFDSTDWLLRLLELLWVQVAKLLDLLKCAPVMVHILIAIAMPLCLCGIALVFFG
ncbi:uncharacterized protein LOC117590240 [Drosophila guanche]|uniref:Uncharacterized protein n=1 Tax=Drosophila guanche TaxID=7266 RepID=A0A3B0K5C7_DROGU|nr:uncharacterized protein LOC117590240 [Drosophila guanche]SPP88503.1 Hypothetical predicted protein [Drosophila guanche]